MAQKRDILVSAPGKIILSGEHSVVYGQPALLTAVNRRLSVSIKEADQGIEIIADEPPDLARYALEKTEQLLKKEIKRGLKIKINSQIPVGRGFGSSAALAVAIVGGLFSYFGKTWDKALINQIAYEIEKKQHGNPSGGDNSVVCFGGFLRFQKRGEKFIIKPLKIKTSLPKFILLDSGRAKETTGEMVHCVSKKYKKEKLKVKRTLSLIGRTTIKTIAGFKKGNFNQLTTLIKENERLLEELGVVGQKAKRLIREIEKLGGAAKICGAGGLKAGSGVVLCYHPKPKIILNFAQKQKLVHFPVKLGTEGVKNEKN